MNVIILGPAGYGKSTLTAKFGEYLEKQNKEHMLKQKELRDLAKINSIRQDILHNESENQKEMQTEIW